MHCSVSRGGRPHVVSRCMVRIQSRPFGLEEKTNIIACAVYSPGHIWSTTHPESPRDRHPVWRMESESRPSTHARVGAVPGDLSPRCACAQRHFPARRGRGAGRRTWVRARRLGSWRVPRGWLCAGGRWWCGAAAGSWPPARRAGKASGRGAGSQAAGALGAWRPRVPCARGCARAGVPRGSPAAARGPPLPPRPGSVPAPVPCSPSP